MNTLYKNHLKRSIDFIAALLSVLVLLPLYLTIIIILFFQNKGTPFFKQKRPGLRQKEIYVLKFKTMTDKKGLDGKLLPDAQRVTKIGKVLRKTSLDELPQLINVIKGDMSLIGPRPLLFEYIPLYREDQVRRHEVRPGITGLAQVNGRNAISWTKKFEYDVLYVNNISFTLDFKIFLLTIKKVFLRQNTEFDKAEGERRFNGYN